MDNKLLIIRFSALGDVAMAAHLVNFINNQRPDLEIYLLSKPNFYPIFSPLKVKTTKIDLKERHKGPIGLWRLSREIKKLGIRRVADIHGVLRSYILDFFLIIQGIKVTIINKERRKKKQLTKGKNIKLIHTIDRYAIVVKKLGVNINVSEGSQPIKYKISEDTKHKFISGDKKNIGIAPFAAHKNKEYPAELMEVVISELNKLNYNILIFGGGKREKNIAENWENKYTNVHSVIGKLKLEEEIALIGSLDLIITMDSGNMHLASLTKTPNITIWGGTHPKMGFTPVGNFYPELAFIKGLPCQPCSVFGSNTCKRGDFACLYQILPSEIVKKTKEIL